MRRAIAAAALALVACKDGSRAIGPSVPGPGATYVGAILDTMQARSLNRKTIDWTNLRSQVFAAVPPGGGITDSYTAILLALELLGDNHSYFVAPDSLTLSASKLDCSAPTIRFAPSLGPDIGYVRVGGDAAPGFADSIQAAIRAADNAQVRGWIVDLRGNPGGTLPPMLAGIGPILGTGTAGYFVDANGVARSWGYDGTAAELGGLKEVSAAAPYSLLSPSPHVAVLLDRRVESSGEATAIAFKQRPNTRFFGTATCGLSTYLQRFQLSDGAYLMLAVWIDADRASNKYGGPVLPDTVIADTSAVVPAAAAWLRTSHP